MIISRTPFRVSFFGGGTDYPAHYREYGGACLSMSIDKYCYIMAREMPPFFDFKSRVVWSRTELVKKNSDIRHPSVRATFDYLDITQGMEIHHNGDLPARTGLGSSSSFTVGLLYALYALRGEIKSKAQLAKEAIHVEQVCLAENVGVQDQIATSFGGLNRIEFYPNDDFTVSPIIITRDRLAVFQDHLMLFFTGVSRSASDIAGDQIKAIPKKTGELRTMYNLVAAGQSILSGNGDITEFGRLLHETWRMKRSLSRRISTDLIDEIYTTAMTRGALGGKLLGAGGGGFVLLFVPPERQAKIREALGKFLYVPIKAEFSGSQIMYCERDNW